MPDVTTVLVVDDHFLFAQAIGAAITGTAGLELAGLAVTGPQALAMVRAGKPDVVLLDHHLPGTTSDQLIPQLHAHAPETRVIVLTSDLAEATKVAAVRAGAAGFLTKDRAVEEVVDAVLGVPGHEPQDRPPPAPTAPSAVPAPHVEVEPAGEGHVVLRAHGVHSLEEVAHLERLVGAIASIERVHATRLSDGSASLIATVRPGRSSGQVARDLVPLLADATRSTLPPAGLGAAMSDALAGVTRPPLPGVRHHERAQVDRRPEPVATRPVVDARPAALEVPGLEQDAMPRPLLGLAVLLAGVLATTAALGLAGPLLYVLAAAVALSAGWAALGSGLGQQFLLLSALVTFVERASAPVIAGIATKEELAAAAVGAVLAVATAGVAAGVLRRSR